MNERDQTAFDYIQKQLQDLDAIHQKAIDALNAVQGKDRLLNWKKQVGWRHCGNGESGTWQTVFQGLDRNVVILSGISLMSFQMRLRCADVI